MTMLFLQTCNMENYDQVEDVAEDGDGDEAGTEDAINIVHATFAVLANDPGATLASFRVVNGVAVHRQSTDGVSRDGEEYTRGDMSD